MFTPRIGTLLGEERAVAAERHQQIGVLSEVALRHALAAIAQLIGGGVVEADAEVARAKIGGDIRGELQRLLRGDLRGDADRLHGGSLREQPARIPSVHNRRGRLRR
jgi:hypothetical protein